MSREDPVKVHARLPRRSGMRLFRAFALLSAGAIVLILLGTGLGGRRLIRQHAIRRAERDASDLSSVVSRFQQDRIARLFGGDSAGLESPDAQALDEMMRAIASSMRLVKIKAFDANRRIVYSPEGSCGKRVPPMATSISRRTIFSIRSFGPSRR